MIVTVNHNGEDVELEFPDDMPQEQIKQAIDSNFSATSQAQAASPPPQKEFRPGTSSPIDSFIAGPSEEELEKTGPAGRDIAGALNIARGISNIPKSAGAFVGNTLRGIAHVAEHPLDTGGMLMNAAAGGLQNIAFSMLPESAKSTEETWYYSPRADRVADAVGAQYKERYGSWSKVADTLINDPVGVAADLSVIAGLGKSVLRMSGMEKAANVAGNVSKAVDPMQSIGKTAAAVAKPIAAQVLGRTSGSGASVYEKAVEASPEFVKQMRSGDEVALVDKTREAFGKMKQARGDAYRKSLDDISASTEKVDTADLTKLNDDLLKTFDVAKNKKGDLDFTYSRLRGDKQASDEVERIHSVITDWQKKNKDGRLSPSELDNLRKTIGDIYESPKLGRNVSKIKEAIADKIDRASPGYKKMNSDYEAASKVIESTEKALLSKDPRAIDTALRKILMGVREEKGLRRQMMDDLSKFSDEDIAALAAGSVSNQWLGRRLESLGPLIGGAWALMPLASPRLTAEATQYFSRAARQIAKTPRAAYLTTEQLGRQNGNEIQ